MTASISAGLRLVVALQACSLPLPPLAAMLLGGGVHCRHLDTAAQRHQQRFSSVQVVRCLCRRAGLGRCTLQLVTVSSNAGWHAGLRQAVTCRIGSCSSPGKGDTDSMVASAALMMPPCEWGSPAMVAPSKLSRVGSRC